MQRLTRVLSLLVAGLPLRYALAEQVAPPPGTKVEPKSHAVTASQRGVVNVARGKPYTLSPAPNYGYCTDPGDATQLTDGQYVSGYFWVQTGTVGWNHTGTSLITIDLGKVEPIRGVSFNTAAGTAGVGWPAQIAIFVSQDGKDYHVVGDLVDLSAARGLPEPLGYRTFTYWTDQLKTKGRYVQVAIVLGSAYGFCDEIEVWRGDDAWVNEPIGGKNVGNVATYLQTTAATSCVRRRMRMDADTIRKAIESSKMSAEQRTAALKKLDDLTKQIDAYTVEDPTKLRAVVPLNDLHAQILAINAEVLQARGLKGLVVWQKNRWDPLGVVEAPETPPTEPLALRIRMMCGEYRSAAFNITNADRVRHKVQVGVLETEPGARQSRAVRSFVTLADVQHVDTKQGVVVADALAGKEDHLGFSLAAGTTGQIWLIANPRDNATGEHKSTVQVQYLGRPAFHYPYVHLKPIALDVHVEDLRFPLSPTLSLGMWDYTNHPPYNRGLTARNVKAAIADAKAHFVDSPWATNGVMPFPQKSQIDGDGNLKTDSLDFSAFDKWFNDWKDYARRHMIFSNVPTALAGFAMGTGGFNRVVGQWYVAWAEHCKRLGIKPKQVALLLVDEPHSDAQHKHILAWAKAIKAATDFFGIWEDPIDRVLGTPAQNAMLDACDAVCPNLGIYSGLGKKAEDFYGKFVAGGKRELWFYQCTGPVRLLDPYAYHRLQAWHCWVHGAVGQGFWAYADAGGGNPWCEYLSGGTTYCPAYVAPDGITTSKHWEAVREGIEDYEYLHMLKRRIDELTKAGKSSPALDNARTLLAEGPKRVAVYEPLNWFQERDRSLADQVRLEILDALLALSKE